MVVLGVLLASLLLFSGLGVLGVEPLSTWQVSAAWALAPMAALANSSYSHTMPGGDAAIRIPARRL